MMHKIHQWSTGHARKALVLMAAAAMFAQVSATGQKGKIDWLPLCGKCQRPIIFSTSGTGTAHAIAHARVTYQSAKGYCGEWSMEDHPDCDKQAKETLEEEKGKIYTATADCVHGRMTDANGENFIYVGLWPKSERYLAGKTRWRWGPGSDGDTGKIVGEDGPTTADLVATTAAILCPNGVGAARKR